MAAAFAAAGLIAGCPNSKEPPARPTAETPMVIDPTTGRAPTRIGPCCPAEPPQPLDANNPLVDPNIRFEDVVIHDSDFDPDLGGNPNAFVTGRLRYVGPAPALERIEIRAARSGRSIDGGWKPMPASAYQAIEAVVRNQPIGFRIRVNGKKAEIERLTMIGYNPEFGSTRKSRWVPLRTPEPQDLETDVPDTDLRLSGNWTNDGAETISAYKVQIDLLNARNELVHTVGTHDACSAERARWGPGTTIRFAVTIPLTKAAELTEFNPRVRAVGLVE